MLACSEECLSGAFSNSVATFYLADKAKSWSAELACVGAGKLLATFDDSVTLQSRSSRTINTAYFQVSIKEFKLFKPRRLKSGVFTDLWRFSI